MSGFTLGAHPATLKVRLVEGFGADLAATAPGGWPSAPILEFGPYEPAGAAAIATKTATVAGEVATWSFSEAELAVLHELAPSTKARIRFADGTVTHAGYASWNDGWTPGETQHVATYTAAAVVIDGGTP